MPPSARPANAAVIPPVSPYHSINARDRLRAVVETLRDGCALVAAIAHRAARDGLPNRDAAKHILIIDELLPDPLFGAGYPRAFAMMEALVQAGHRVSMYPMNSTSADLARANAAFKGQVRFHRGAGARGLRRLLWKKRKTLDALMISRPAPMRAWCEAGIAQRKGRPLPVIYDAEAIVTPREATRRALFGRPWSKDEYQAALTSELELVKRADVVTTVSSRDSAIIGSAVAKPVLVVPHPVSVNGNSEAFDARGDFLFVGRLTGSADASPNVDSVMWFVEHIMPTLDSMLGRSYRLHVAGLIEAPDLTALRSDRVLFHGVVEDLTQFYERCRVFVAPTRFAAGIPLKVIEAMGSGMPCVATPLLRDQLACSEDALPTGKTAGEFAEACRRLYTDAAHWEAVRDAGRHHIGHCYSLATFESALAQAIILALNPS